MEKKRENKRKRWRGKERRGRSRKKERRKPEEMNMKLVRKMGIGSVYKRECVVLNPKFV